MLAIVYLTVLGTYTPPSGQIILYDNELLIGIGDRQCKAELTPVKAGVLRSEYCVELPADIADDRDCWLYTDDDQRGDGENSLTCVLVEV